MESLTQAVERRGKGWKRERSGEAKCENTLRVRFPEPMCGGDRYQRKERDSLMSDTRDGKKKKGNLVVHLGRTLFLAGRKIGVTEGGENRGCPGTRPGNKDQVSTKIQTGITRVEKRAKKHR